MSTPTTTEPAIIQWGVASASYAGQEESGDLALVTTFPDGALVAVIDGLGHGPEAAIAARVAGKLLAAHPSDDPVAIVERCHEGLRKTRGVVMSLASWSARSDSLTWLGVGNVEGVLVRRDGQRPREELSLRGGVVGYRLPPLRSESLSVARGDTLVFATDGVAGSFKSSLELELVLEPQSLADSLLARFGKGSDDACVATARYVALPSVRIPVRHSADASTARQRLRELAYRRGFDEVAVERMATAISELAHNIVTHAGSGEIDIAFCEQDERAGLCIVASDNGPGIPDIDRAMQDEFSTGKGLGLGLSSARRFADEFAIDSIVGQGTTVTFKKWLP
jgi:anti-sigma regulatory factor (Ser/Thr protein kinase)